MTPKFGTSGLRGLVTELTPNLINDYVRAFAASCPMGTGLFVAQDLRRSSPQIAAQVMQAARSAGLLVSDCGAAPTPALALAATRAGAAAIMVTGSHIPADRNGLKFYTPQGEITKSDETAILAALGRTWQDHDAPVAAQVPIQPAYLDRYTTSFAGVLNGMTIGVYGHSAVGRDLLIALVRALGGTAVQLGWSDVFVPVDTEAVPAGTRDQLVMWATDHGLDAIVSTDGDGDRPLMTDQYGRVIAGDLLGQITADYLDAASVVTPVSSNTGVERKNRFDQVHRCKIGSPYVIAQMQSSTGNVVGYEANGGFLLGFDATGPSGPIPALLTRDAVLPMLAALAASRNETNGLTGLVAAQPARFTAADRLEGIATETSLAFVAELRDDPAMRQRFLHQLDAVEDRLDLVDGLRIYCADQRVIHLRPSGNAPELRLYVEASDTDIAQQTLVSGLALIKRSLD